MRRSRWRVVRVSTWFLGWQTVRTYIAPWEWETQVALVPGLLVCFKWGWHCEECRERYS